LGNLFLVNLKIDTIFHYFPFLKSWLNKIFKFFPKKMPLSVIFRRKLNLGWWAFSCLSLVVQITCSIHWLQGLVASSAWSISSH
jgi:hypothetical protein